MAKQEKASPKQKVGRPSGRHGTVTGVLLPHEAGFALDRWIADQPDPRHTRSEAMRRIVTAWLRQKGYLRSDT